MPDIDNSFDSISCATSGITSITTEKPVGEMRFLDGVLQQRFHVTHYGDRGPSGVSDVWRDVPHVTSPAKAS
jgi:hypothetical protein